MSIAHSTALDALWVSLSVFLVVLSLALVYAVIRLHLSAARLAAALDGIETKATASLRNVEATVERLNARLGRVEGVADRAVGALSRLESGLGTVTSAVSRPARKVSSLAAGVARGNEERTG